jgi:hypothetical protein
MCLIEHALDGLPLYGGGAFVYFSLPSSLVRRGARCVGAGETISIFIQELKGGMDDSLSP